MQTENVSDGEVGPSPAGVSPALSPPSPAPPLSPCVSAPPSSSSPPPSSSPLPHACLSSRLRLMMMMMMAGHLKNTTLFYKEWFERKDRQRKIRLTPAALRLRVLETLEDTLLIWGHNWTHTHTHLLIFCNIIKDNDHFNASLMNKRVSSKLWMFGRILTLNGIGEVVKRDLLWLRRRVLGWTGYDFLQFGWTGIKTHD